MASNSKLQMNDEEGMRDVIALINRLQDVATATNLPPNVWDLPQMAVVGEQSAGKSSVLENIVGKDFLPRGTGIVTRCPLVLQLIHSESDYAEFIHKPNIKFTDYESVKKEILSQTDIQAGGEKAISDKPINLKIYSPEVPHLTLIDLPGLTKVPVGVQPENIEQITRDLILKYIQPENTLILAVTQATQDLANSDALQMAQTVDPKGLRTIGVITKLDLMDNGTDARDILDNKVFPLFRGYIGLVNRSKDDIDRNRDIKSAQEKERRFFAAHKCYCDIAHKMGAKYLRSRLSEQLCNHIREKLPTIQSQVKKEHSKAKQILDAMSAFDEDKDGEWQHGKVIELVQKFTEEFHKQMEGLALNMNSDTLTGGAKLNECIYTQIYPLLDQRLFTSKEELHTLWQKMTGYRNIMYFTQQAFDNVIRKHLQQYKQPLETATILCAVIVRDSIKDCTYKLDAYPYLKQEVVRLMTDEIVKNEEDTRVQLFYHIKAQKSFMNIYHPDFMKQSDPEPKLNELQQVSPSNSISSLVFDDATSVQDENFVLRNELLRSQVNVHSTLGTKSLLLVLYMDRLVWFKDDYDSRPRGSITLDGFKVTISKSRNRGKRFTLQSGDKSKRQSITVSFKNETEENEWLQAFHRIGATVLQDNVIADEQGTIWQEQRQQQQTQATAEVGTFRNQTEQSKPQINSGIAKTQIVKIEGDPRQRFNDNPVLDEVVQKLNSYTQILSETIHDLTPKYIGYFLINKTLKYTKRRLLTDIQKEESSRLLRMSDEELSKRDDYFRIFKATGNALDIIGGVTASKSKKNLKKKKVMNSSDELETLDKNFNTG